MGETADWKRLSRYLAGETSEEEERQVEAWLADDPGHRALLDDLRRIWEVAEQPRDHDLPSPQEMDVDRKRLLRTIRQRDAASASSSARASAPDRTARRSNRSAARRLLNPFGTRIAGAALALTLLIGGVVLAVQMTGGWGGDDALVQVIQTARGERATARLSDSTRVWLSVDSELRVPKTFDQDKRTVELRGEAYFKVPPNADRPFIVRSGSAQVRVLGTAFGITAYPADSSVQVVVREGSVALQPDGSPHPDRGATLRRNELGRLGHAHDRITTQSVNANEYLGWIDNRLDFHSTPLSEVARRLERWYDVEVRLNDPSLATRRLTATFEDASVGSVAEVIATTLNIEQRADGQTIVFSAP